MPLDPKVIGELKEALLKEKSDLEENLSRIAKPINKNAGDYQTSFDEIGSAVDDNATEVEEFSDNLPVEVTLENKLRDVIEALDKIKKGTYGICDNCNQEIDLERLQINPSAKTCLNCK